MGNTIITPQVVAREALLLLKDHLSVPMLFNMAYTSEFAKGKGDTVKARVPATFTADEFAGTTSAQDVVEPSASIQVDHLADVSFEIGSKEKALDIENLKMQVIDPAVAALAAKVNYDCLMDPYGDIANYVGTAGSLPTDVSTMLAARKLLNTSRVPMADRRLILGPDLEEKLLGLDTFKNAEKSGSTDALREASLGKVYQFDTFSGNEEMSHTAGAYAAATDPLLTGTEGATTVAMAATTGTGTLLRGDLFVCDGVKYTVIETTAAAAANAIAAVKIYPALHADLTDEAVTFVASNKFNIAFHKSAFAFVNPKLEAPEGGAKSYSISVDGLSLRVTQGYNMSSKKELMSLDMIYGIKCLDPRRAVRVLN